MAEVSLKEVLDALDFASSDIAAYVDRTSGKVVTTTEEERSALESDALLEMQPQLLPRTLVDGG